MARRWVILLYAVLEVLLSLLAVFGLFVLGYLTFSHVLSPGRAAAPAYAVVPAKGDGAALEQTVKRLLWLRTGVGQCYTVVIADAGLDPQGLTVATLLANAQPRVVLCPMESVTNYLI